MSYRGSDSPPVQIRCHTINLLLAWDNSFFHYCPIFGNETLPGPLVLINASEVDSSTDLIQENNICRTLFHMFIKLKTGFVGIKAHLSFKDSTLVPAAMGLCNVQRDSDSRSSKYTDTELMFSQHFSSTSYSYRYI